MKLIEATAELLPHLPYPDMVRNVCTAFSACYGVKVPETLQEQEAKVRARIKAGHMSVIEHVGFSARLLTDRGITHEAVRHRLTSPTEQSTRYSLKADGDMSFRIPESALAAREKTEFFIRAYKIAESLYHEARALGCTPDEARYVTPAGLAAGITITANMREWRKIFGLRVLGWTGKPHPEMVYVMKQVYELAKKEFPCFFDDLNPATDGEE